MTDAPRTSASAAASSSLSAIDARQGSSSSSSMMPMLRSPLRCDTTLTRCPPSVTRSWRTPMPGRSTFAIRIPTSAIIPCLRGAPPGMPRAVASLLAGSCRPVDPTEARTHADLFVSWESSLLAGSHRDRFRVRHRANIAAAEVWMPTACESWHEAGKECETRGCPQRSGRAFAVGEEPGGRRSECGTDEFPCAQPSERFGGVGELHVRRHNRSDDPEYPRNSEAGYEQRDSEPRCVEEKGGQGHPKKYDEGTSGS